MSDKRVVFDSKQLHALSRPPFTVRSRQHIGLVERLIAGHQRQLSDLSLDDGERSLARRAEFELLGTSQPVSTRQLHQLLMGSRCGSPASPP